MKFRYFQSLELKMLFRKSCHTNSCKKESFNSDNLQTLAHSICTSGVKKVPSVCRENLVKGCKTGDIDTAVRCSTCSFVLTGRQLLWCGCFCELRMQPLPEAPPTGVLQAATRNN